MRIIAGRYRRLKLKTIPGTETRPTLDRVRESFFSRIGPSFEGDTVLDLYAGSGAIGYEVLSRNGAYVVLNDHNAKVFKVLEENAQQLKLDSKQYKLLRADALKAIAYCQKEALVFDWVYLDPPYAVSDMERVFNQLSSVLKPEGKVYYEIDQMTEVGHFEGYKEMDRYEFPRTSIIVYQLVLDGLSSKSL